MARLSGYYKDEVVPRMKEKFHYRNPMQVPRVEKVIINMGLGEAIDNIKLMGVALPRVRDFKGFSPKGFDGRGNYTLGVREQIIFPEINYDKIDKIRGMNITIVTTARSDEEGLELLRLLGMPFRA